MVKEEQLQGEGINEIKEITLKFGKGYVSDTLTGKDGNKYKRIMIPNSDENDKSPWASFLVRADAVHEDISGKSMMLKLPEGGYTTVSKNRLVTVINGEKIWNRERNKVTNIELKEMMEAYKKEAKEENRKEFKEITLKFGKGLVGEAFKGKDGNEYRSILVPNRDENDKSPWASFVVKANAVHEDKFGKGMWIKLPSEGHTTISKSVLASEKDGKKVWDTEKTKVANTELKKMVEFYKDRPRTSLMEKLNEKKGVVEQNKSEKPKELSKAREEHCKN